MKKRSVIIILLIVTAIAVTGIITQSATAFSPQETANLALDALEITDAQYLGSTTLDAMNPAEYLRYHSESAQMSFYFNTSDGKLELAQSEADRTEQSPLGELSDADHCAYVLEYAEGCIAAALIGELRIDHQSAPEIAAKSYELVEYYDNIPTGTRVWVSCMENGEIFYVIPVYGTVFEQNTFGGYSLKKGDDLLDESVVCEIAGDRVAQILADADYVRTDVGCAVMLAALEDELYYCIEIETVNEQGWMRTYVVDVDAYDGEILEITYTK